MLNLEIWSVLPKHYNIPIFIPELACPFQCVFCNQRKITGKQLIPKAEEIVSSINEHLSSFKETDRVVEIGYFGGSFTGIPIEQQKHFLSLARPFLESKQVNGIRISTRPDYINQEILSLLKDSGVTTIELGAQSLDDRVLKASFRGHTSRQTEKASTMILEYGFELGLQMMIGLPGDTFERAFYTANRIIELGASNTRIYPTVVIRDTALHNWYEQGKYQPLPLEEAVEWTGKLMPLFENAGVNILRVGLHPSEGLLDRTELVAGPFHPSFRELVLTRIWRDKLWGILSSSTHCNTVEISVPHKELNYAIGYHGSNRKMLLETFSTVRFHADKKLGGRAFNYVTA